MRYDRHMTFQATTGPRSAWRFVAREGQYTVTAEKAFRARKRACTLIVLRVPGQDHPWVVLTDEPPDDVDLGAYGLRVWIEQGFRTLKRMGWQWHRTRRLDPARVDRHGLVLAVATLWVLAYGTRVVARGKPKKVALVAAMHKLLTLLNAVMRDKTPWRTPPQAMPGT